MKRSFLLTYIFILRSSSRFHQQDKALNTTQTRYVGIIMMQGACFQMTGHQKVFALLIEWRTQRNSTSCSSTTTASDEKSASLRQTTLNMSIKGRKRTLTLVSGGTCAPLESHCVMNQITGISSLSLGEVDLNTMKADQATPEVCARAKMTRRHVLNRVSTYVWHDL